ncbi:hypothetical protein G3I55_34265 [Streptomyces sp. SID6648]|nr:hypothetical protein [Streptomyces sp. SID6648]
MILAQTDSWRFAELAEPSRPEDSPASADGMGGIWRSLIKAMLERAGSLAADADADDLADQPTSFLCGP